MLADPEVFSGSLIPAIVQDFEVSASASAGFQSPLEHMRNVVQHTIQAALGPEHCHGPKLAQALRVSGLRDHLSIFFIFFIPGSPLERCVNVLCFCPFLQSFTVPFSQYCYIRNYVYSFLFCLDDFAA